jgi:DNA-binding CsgD family transcriptional regulator
VLSQLGDLHLRQGRWDESAAELAEAVEIGDLIDLHVGARSDLAALVAARGQSELAGELADAATVGLERTPALHRMQIHARDGFVHLAGDDCHGALTRLIRAREQANSAKFAAPLVLAIEPDLVEAAVQAGELEVAQDACAALAAAATRLDHPFVSALAGRSRALVAGASGEIAEALDLVLQAIEFHGDGPRVPFEEARTRLIAGRLLRRAGRRREARHQVETALDVFEQLDAQAFVRRARAELDRLRTRQAPTGLSPTEDQVARLAAAGHTNVEIANELAVSVRTVESNLTRVYRKLGVRSRTELAGRLATPA